MINNLNRTLEASGYKHQDAPNVRKLKVVTNLHYRTFDVIYCFTDPLVRWAVVNVPKASQLISALMYFCSGVSSQEVSNKPINKNLLHYLWHVI